MQPHLFPSFGILLVDDEAPFLRSLAVALERRAGINHLYQCQQANQVMAHLNQHPIGLVLLDLNMPDMSGQELLQQIVREHPDVCVIIISGMNQVELAVHCMQLGAFNYFVKTTEEKRLIDGIRKTVMLKEMCLEHQTMRERFLTDTLQSPEAFQHILTINKQMRAVFQYLESVAVSSQPLLITGESGVGKELIAGAVHSLSQRNGPLISLNAAGLDDNVFADTLFGHKRGAFTGADRDRPGMIERAAGGTLFLDEIGDLSLTSQVKLLRLLQEGEYFPLGSDKPKYCRARIIAATHQNLEEKQATQRFRKDLYFRLKTHQVVIPPLRQRQEDIPILFEHYLHEAAKELNKSKPSAPKELWVLLSNYTFPGNVRELRALAYDAVSRHTSKMLSMDAFRHLLDRQTRPHTFSHEESVHFHPEHPLPSIQEIGDLLVQEALKRTSGNQSMASRMLGISQPALSKRLKKQ